MEIPWIHAAAVACMPSFLLHGCRASLHDRKALVLCVQGDHDTGLRLVLQLCLHHILNRSMVLTVQGDYDIPLSVYYDYVFTAAEQSGAALMQPWELVPFHVPPGQPTPLLTSARALSAPHSACAVRRPLADPRLKPSILSGRRT